jgi:hypothetical protein
MSETNGAVVLDKGGVDPARPIPSRTPRAGWDRWVAQLWCGFCALTPRFRRALALTLTPAAGTRLPAVKRFP